MSDLYPWLESCRDSIASTLNQGRLPHALLITGQPGLGKAVFAKSLANMLLCQNPLKNHEPCGTCPGCIQLKAGSHPDYFRVEFLVDDKTGKVSKEIKVDQIRELTEKLTLSSHQGGYKVAVLNPADAMNINASNSLLKTLEEPSDNTVLVLVCTQPARLPATVRSRCQQLQIEAPDKDEALRWLDSQGHGDTAATYLDLALGAPLEALEQAQKSSIEARQERFASLVGILEGRTSPLAVAQVWAKDENMQGIRWMRDWLMDLLRIRMTGDNSGVRSADLAESLSSLARRLDSKVLFGELERINRTLRMTASSLNRQLLTEEILLAWAAQN
jgi:DNA polymerase-3 subunit delta'